MRVWGDACAPTAAPIEFGKLVCIQTIFSSREMGDREHVSAARIAR